MKYAFDIVSVGENVSSLLKTSKCITLVNDGCSEGLAAMSIVHTREKLAENIKAGDTLEWGALKFKIVEVGSDVNKNLADIGHCTILFNKRASLPGQMSVEGAYLPSFNRGETVKIY